MNIDPMIRFHLLQVGLLCGGLFAAYRVLLTVMYPLLSSVLWQHVLGSAIEARWKGTAQCDDYRRPSYMPLEDGQPYVMAWGLLPPPVDDLTYGIRDGLLLGVLAALLPEVMSAGMLTLLLALILGKGAWRISKHHGAARTDHAFWAAKEVFIYLGAVAALNTVGLGQ